MSNKKKFSQAVKDLLNKPITSDTLDPVKEYLGNEELDDIKDIFSSPSKVAPEPAKQTQAPTQIEMTEEQVQPMIKEKEKTPVQEAEIYENHSQSSSVVPTNNEKPAEWATKPNDCIAVISPNTVIVGTINSADKLFINGSIKGDVTCSDNCGVNGKIIGNLRAKDLRLTGAQIRGDVMADGNIVLDVDTVVMGDIVADSIFCDGKVRGNLQIKNHAILNCNALVWGDLEVGSISVSDGAVINGHTTIGSSKDKFQAEFPKDINFDF